MNTTTRTNDDHRSAIYCDLHRPSTFTRNTAQLERSQPVVFSARPGMPMTPDRYHLLSESDDPEDCLTEEEMAAGWHYCYEFDGLLVGPGMGELECFRCTP